MRRLSRRSLGWRLEVDSSRGSGSTVRVRTSPVKGLRSGDRGPRRPVCSASRGVTGPARVADGSEDDLLRFLGRLEEKAAAATAGQGDSRIDPVLL